MPDVLRSALWLGFFAAILAAWAWMYAASTGMGLDLLGRQDARAAAMAAMDPRMDMDMPMARFWPLFAMWAVMMAAMMGPTLVPTLSTYERLMQSADGSRAGWSGVIVGYFLVWIGFAGLLASVQLALLFGGYIDMLGILHSSYVAAGLLFVVGLFQFSRAKEICHGVCISPMSYFLGRWQPGGIGGLRMGTGLGAYCVGCCWGMMALGFVGGMMNLAWMGLATLFMVVEKLPQIGLYLRKPAGAGLMLAGLAVGTATMTGG